jgi:aspartyl-tRNA(Asn)/glutamyl-tRNA(Gln) amidotransferase subunit B
VSTEKTIFEKYPEYQAVIGIEVHVQLKTKTKLFCSCTNKFGSDANANVCEVCLGLLGSLPVLNKKALDFAIKAGIATNCTISRVCDFARKHYMYPDIPKNYQITQSDRPICTDGYIAIAKDNGDEKKVRLNRIHVEEDAGKNFHSNLNGGCTLVDFNRAGSPLIEIVSEPDIASPKEARDYLARIRAIVQYLDISNANMEEGSFRADINVSVKKKSTEMLGTKVELKNINSFKFVEMAAEHEIRRQIEVLENGDQVKQETRSWDEKEKKTFCMRSKEDAYDYRYFPDPDLPILIIDQEWIDRLEEEVPELPGQKYKRFQEEYGLSAYESEILTSEQRLADFFEKAVAKCKQPKSVSNWMLRDLLGYVNEQKITLEQIKITPEMFAELIMVIETGVINSSVGREVFLAMAQAGKYPSIIIQEKGLEQINSESELEEAARQVTTQFYGQFAEFKAGNERLLGFLVGQTMKLSSGKANPQMLNKIFFRLAKEK